MDAQAKLREFKAMRCPFPHLGSLVPLQESTPQSQENCGYVFSRAYDLRRHLGAVHEVEVNQEAIAQWVKLKKTNPTTSDL